jgi:hypothetical protein
MHVILIVEVNFKSSAFVGSAEALVSALPTGTMGVTRGTADAYD